MRSRCSSGDPFAYEAKDEVIHAYRRGVVEVEKVEFPEVRRAHVSRP